MIEENAKGYEDQHRRIIFIHPTFFLFQFFFFFFLQSILKIIEIINTVESQSDK